MTHKKPHYRPIKFSELSARLEELYAEDQSEVMEFSRNYDDLTDDERLQRSKQLTMKCRNRVVEALKIIDTVKLPRLSFIGQSGAQALSVLSLHANLSAMELVLTAFEKCLTEYPDDTYLAAIPSLMDRIQVLKRQKQIYGTQWMPNAQGVPFLFPVQNFNDVNSRRADYGLEPLRRPIDLSKLSASDEIRISAISSDQKQPTEEEYMNFAREYLD